MLQSIDPNLQLILNSVQLAVYAVILGLTIYKLIKSLRASKDFFAKFYGCVTAIACIEIAMQSYQLKVEDGGEQPQIYIVLMANIYAMGCEAATILFLSDYWHETKEIITKTSTEIEIREERHWLRHALLALWLAVYTAYIVYTLTTGKLEDNQAFHLVLTLGCQGIAATILLWSILLQVMRGHYLSSAVGRYQEWMNSTAIHQSNFRCLWWTTSICNFLRVLFLITATIVMEVYGQKIGWGWLAAYIYTGSNCIVLLVYIFAFSTSTMEETVKVSTLLEGRVSENSARSRHETQLSSSVSDRSNKNDL